MSGRTTLTFLTGRNRFNYRVAGVIIRDNHVLVCREDTDDFVLLPGGRVEFGEASDKALYREIEEELMCTARVERLLFSAENFFEREGERYHEIAHYYAVTLPDEFPFETNGPSMVKHEEGHVLTFEWVPVEAQALERFNVLPGWIRQHFVDWPAQAEHMIIDER